MKDLLKELESSTKPITHVLQKTASSKVIAVGLNSGVTLAKHKAPGVTRLVVVQGSIQYQTDFKEMVLQSFDSYDIPLDEIHSVTGIEKAVFLLLVG